MYLPTYIAFYLFQDSDFSGESYILVAKDDEDLIVKDFEDEDRDEDGDLEEFGKKFGFKAYSSR